MRIALVSINAWPLIGGVEKNAHRLAQTLQAKGDSCRMITRFCQRRTDLAGYFRDTETIQHDLIDGVATDVVPLGWFERLLWLPLFRLIWRPITFPLAVALHNLVMVPKLIRRFQDAQVIHFLGSGPELFGFAAAAAARKLRVPLMVEPALHPGQWGDSWIDRRLYQQADRILAHSQAESKVLQQMGIALMNIEVITHGVDRQVGGSEERFRRHHGIAADAPLVLFLGRKTRQKGVYRLLRAFHEVQRSIPDALLVLAGPTAEELDLDLEKTPCVLNLHQLSEAAKQDALAACTLLCVPSEGESFGLVYYEAWHYRKPVVALDLPCLRESIAAHSAGLLVQVEQPHALSEALLTLLNNPQLAAQMGQRGRDLVECHSWNHAIRSYQNVYRQSVKK
jgi:glycosyltransferase involved in cell wall biosynthesis